MDRTDVLKAIEVIRSVLADRPHHKVDWHLVTPDGDLLPLKPVYAFATKRDIGSFNTYLARRAFTSLGFEVVQMNNLRHGTTVRSFWWVNHKQTYKEEIEGGYIWSPTSNQNGARNQTYINFTLVRPSDVVISYAGAEIRAIGVVTSSFQDQPKPEVFGRTGQNWSETGWLVPVEWSVLEKPLSPKAHLADIVELLPAKHSPLQANGNGNQSCYLANISPKLGTLILQLTRATDAAAIDRVLELEDQLQADEVEREIQQDEQLPLTEREQLVRSRVGQGVFRLHVLGVEKACRLTGVADERFLIASHIKPWRHCSNAERLDGHNGLMLAPHVDKLFDRGWISFADYGYLLVADDSPLAVMAAWGISGVLNVGAFSAQQKAYLVYHREIIFRGSEGRAAPRGGGQRLAEHLR